MSADGRRLLTLEDLGEAQYEARVWDTLTGLPVSPRLRPAKGDCLGSLGGNGRSVITYVTTGTDWRQGGCCQVWDVASGKLVPGFPELVGRECMVNPEFSRDGRWLVTLSMLEHPDGLKLHPWLIRIWDAETGKVRGEPVQLELRLSRPYLYLSADAAVLGVQCIFDNHRLYDAATGKQIAELPQADGGDLNGYFSFSPDGNTLLTSSKKPAAGYQCRLWNARSGVPLSPTLILEQPLLDHEFSPDGQRVLLSSGSGINTFVNAKSRVQVFDIKKGVTITPAVGEEEQRESGHLSPDGRQFALFGGAKVRIWDAVDGKPLTPVLPHGSAVRGVEFSADGECVVTQDDDGTVRIWDAVQGTPPACRFRPGGLIRSATLSPNGKVALIQTWGDVERKPTSAYNLAQATGVDPDFVVLSGWTLRLWDTTTGRPLTEPMGDGGAVSWPEGQFSADGTLVAAWQADRVVVRQTATGEPLGPEIRVGQPVVGAFCSPAGERVLVGYEVADAGKPLTYQARFWDPLTGQPTSPPFGLPNGVYFAPQFCCHGQRVLLVAQAGSGSNWTARIFDGAGQAVSEILTGVWWFLDAEGARLIEVDAKDTVRIRDACTGDALGEPVSFAGTIQALWFDRREDAACVLYGDRTNPSDGEMRLWTSKRGQLATRLSSARQYRLGVAPSIDGAFFSAAEGRAVGARRSADGHLLAAPVRHPGEVSQYGVFGPLNLLLTVCDDQDLEDPRNVRPGGRATMRSSSSSNRLSLTHFSMLPQRGPQESWGPMLWGNRAFSGELRVWDARSGELVLPPLPRVSRRLGENSYASELSGDGRRLLRCPDDRTVEVWELPQDKRPVEQLAAVAEALSGRRFDESGTLTALPAAEWTTLRQRYPETKPLVAPDLFAWHRAAADRCTAASEWRAAERHLNRLVALSPGDRSLYLERGGVSCYLQHHEAGLEDFRRGLALPAPDGFQGDSLRAFGEADRLRYAGNWLGQANKMQEAESAYGAAIVVLDGLLAAHPLSNDYRSALAARCSDLGQMFFDQKRYADAAPLFRKAASLREQLVKHFPKEDQHALDLAWSYRNLAWALEKEDKFAESLRFEDKALATVKPLLGREAAAADVRLLARNIHWGRAVTLDALKRYPEAAEAWTEALQLSPHEKGVLRLGRALSRAKSGDHAPATKEADELVGDSGATAADFYNAACVFGIAVGKVQDDRALKDRYAKRALELLIGAKEKGLFQDKSERDNLHKDTDLDALRSLEGFKKLAEELEATK